MTVASTTGFPPAGQILIRTANAYEYVNFTGKTATTFTGLTRGQSGNLNALITLTANSPVATMTNTSGIQIGQYIAAPGVPQNGFVANLNANVNITLSQAAFLTGTYPAIITPMGLTAQTWTYSANTPTVVEGHQPMYAPSISHWGTSVIMDGRFDDDKSFVFTQGTPSGVTILPGQRAAIQSFRISPSVSNGVAGSGLVPSSRSPMGSTATCASPGMGLTFKRGKAAAMKSRQISAGAPPPVTFFIGVLSSRPTQTAAVKPPV
jgi:hypothetical protein